MKGSQTVLTVLALAGAMLITAAVAGAAAGQTKATHGDPFSACSRATDIFGGAVFPSTEPEVWLAANPAHPEDLIGSIQQDRWDDGGAQGLVAPYSLNDGKSWKEVPLPFSVCASSHYHGNVLKDPFTGRPYDRASDPWVSVGPDGTAYAVTISFDANDNGGAVGAATSRDGGKTWHNQQNITGRERERSELPLRRQGVRHRRSGARGRRVRGVGPAPGHRVSGGCSAGERDDGRAALSVRLGARRSVALLGHGRSARLLRRPGDVQPYHGLRPHVVDAHRDRSADGERADDRKRDRRQSEDRHALRLLPVHPRGQLADGRGRRVA